ncbi:MAG: DEAD/DEAH box helicase [Acidimicrobiia bacterium]
MPPARTNPEPSRGPSPTQPRDPDDRVVLDARLDGGQLWLLTDPHERLRLPHLGDLSEIIGANARPVHQSFWVAPTGFERRWSVAVDEASALRAIIATRWPVTPALGVLLELYLAARRIVADGLVLPGPLPNFATAWIAVPDRKSAGPLADALARASEVHPDAEDLCGYLIHTLASAALGPVPPALDGRRPSATYTRWAERVAARRAAGARLVLRLDESGDSFELVPSLHARRATAVMAEVKAADVRTPDPELPDHDAPDAESVGPLAFAEIAAQLQVSETSVAALVDAEWAAAQRAWPVLKDLPPVRRTLPLDDVVRLVETAAPRLMDAGIAVVLPAHLGRRRTTTRSYHVRGTTTGFDVANLILTGEVRVGDTELTPAELDALVSSRHDLVSLGGRFTFLADGERARIAQFVRRLGTTDAAAVLEAAADIDEDDDTALEVDLDPDSWLARALAGSWRPEPAERIPEPDLVKVPLRDYQREGLDWLVWLERNDLGGILADDMGLGKTAMLLALTAYDHSGPTLVVAPTSVVGNWMREAERFTPGLRVAVHHGGTRGDPVAAVASADIVVTSYGLLRRDARLAQVPWHRVILDEAQAIKNPQTATAKASRSLTAKHRIAATGTPVENHLDELWSIMTFANPGLLSTRTAFAAQYQLGGAGNEDLDAQRLAHLRRRIAAFVCRHTKTDPGIVDELPDRIVVRDDCLLTNEQVTLYQATARAMLDEVSEITDTKRRRLHVFAGIAKLKQICNHPASLDANDTSELAGRSGKLDRLVELAEEIVAEDEAVVVFSQYAGFLRRVAPHLEHALGLEVPVLHGGVPRARRDEIVERFSAGHGGGVLAVSLRAGGTGLNLVRANHVIHFDRWWNPAVEDQASDRVWRIGQTRGVEVHTLVCPGTIEERIAKVIEAKRALAGSVIASTETMVTELDDDELASFVQLDVADATGAL